jgi:hypothetical protein
MYARNLFSHFFDTLLPPVLCVSPMAMLPREIFDWFPVPELKIAIEDVQEGENTEVRLAQQK